MIDLYDLPRKLNPRLEAVRFLGHGGFGAVFQGRNLRTQQTVAIKYLFKKGAEDRSVRQRALAEARTLAQLEHDNIVRIFDVERDRDRDWFLVTQYIDGVDLAEELSNLRRQRSWIARERALGIIEGVMSALAYVQQRGILHRDIKPQNILLDHDKPLLCDFGIAVPCNGRQPLLVGRGGTGTLIYQHQDAREGRENFKTDLFSLGIVAYQLLAGVHPFVDPSFTSTEPFGLLGDPAYAADPLCKRQSDVLPEIGRVVDRMLMKDFHAQYRDAAEALTDFRRARAFVRCACGTSSAPTARYCHACGKQLLSNRQ